MSSRKSNDNSSNSGVSYPGGSGNAAAQVVKGVNYSQMSDSNRLLLKQGGFNGNPVEVFADGAVWDTVLNRYLFPGTDYNPQDLNRK